MSPESPADRQTRYAADALAAAEARRKRKGLAKTPMTSSRPPKGLKRGDGMSRASQRVQEQIDLGKKIRDAAAKLKLPPPPTPQAEPPRREQAK